MTSDAKVGLLLGLVFIFIIAFLINGLPTFRGSRDNSDMTSIMLNSRDNTIGLRNEDIAFINRSNGFGGQGFVGGDFETDYSVPRYQIPLDGIGPGPMVEQSVLDRAAEKVVGDGLGPSFAVDKVKVPGPRRPVRHVVKSMENLSTIAVKYYGSEEGNKLANIKRIFEANRRVLKSMDEVFEGQKLVIPPLKGTVGSVSKSKSILDHPLLERAKNIGRIRSPGGTVAKKSRYYTVRDGDNLWRISAKMLKDGKRYKEILKLNSKALPDEDSLKVGMRLRIPSQ